MMPVMVLPDDEIMIHEANVDFVNGSLSSL